MSFSVAAGEGITSITVGATSISGALTLVAGTNITLTPSGNSITIDASGGGGGGANTSLSNLSSVAINDSLIFDPSSSGIISTGVGFSSSLNLRLTSGDVVGPGMSSGNIYVRSGNADGGFGSASSGDIILSPGSIISSGLMGTIRFQDASAGTAGYIWTSIDSSGGGQWKQFNIFTYVRVITGDVTLSAVTDNKVVADQPGGGTFTITLPPGSNGLSFGLVRAATDTATWTIVPDGADLLDSNIQTIFDTAAPTPITFISGTWYAV